MPPRIPLRRWPVPNTATPIRRCLHATRTALTDSNNSSSSSSSTLHPNPSVKPSVDAQDPVKKDTDPRGGSLPHVSEEAAATARSMGQVGPEVEKGVPVGEAVKNDPQAIKNLPKVMRDSLAKQNKGGAREFSTLARRMQGLDLGSASSLQDLGQAPNLEALQQARREQGAKEAAAAAEAQDGPELSLRVPFEDEVAASELPEGSLTLDQLADAELPINDATARAIAAGLLPDPVELREAAWMEARERLRFGEAVLPERSFNVRKQRYEDIVEQFTQLMIKDGKKARAQKFMQEILTHLRTAPAPRLSSARPLVAGSPPSHALPLNPTTYIRAAIDSVAPVLRIRTIKGAGGGGTSIQVPMAINLRLRRRTAIMWILDAADKKRGGAASVSKRIADEIVSVAEGRSAAWEKRSAVHKLGVGARTQVGKSLKFKKRM